MLKNNFIKIAFVVGLLLLIPLILTIRDGKIEGVEWNWSFGDFVFAFIILFGGGATFELLGRRVSKIEHKIAIGALVATVIFLIWIELAVEAVSKFVLLFVDS